MTQSTTSPTRTAVEGLSIVIPAYNEVNGIADTLNEVHTELDKIDNLTYEVIVVDDGSTDGTIEAAQIGDKTRVIPHEVNRGYGAALKTGIRHATYPLVCIIDADGTYPPAHIAELLEVYQDRVADMVVGARTGQTVQTPLIRRPAKWAIRQLASYVAGQPIPDINSGLRLFQRDIAIKFFNILPDAFSFTTTITLTMLMNGYLVRYVPIDYYHRVGQSKIKPIRDTLNFTQLVLKIGLYFQPLKVFVPLSIILMLLALAVGVFTVIIVNQLADVSALVLAMTSVQVLMLGLIAELINYRIPHEYKNDD